MIGLGSRPEERIRQIEVFEIPSTRANCLAEMRGGSEVRTCAVATSSGVELVTIEDLRGSPVSEAAHAALEERPRPGRP